MDYCDSETLDKLLITIWSFPPSQQLQVLPSEVAYPTFAATTRTPRTLHDVGHKHDTTPYQSIDSLACDVRLVFKTWQSFFQHNPAPSAGEIVEKVGQATKEFERRVNIFKGGSGTTSGEATSEEEEGEEEEEEEQASEKTATPDDEGQKEVDALLEEFPKGWSAKRDTKNRKWKLASPSGSTFTSINSAKSSLSPTPPPRRKRPGPLAPPIPVSPAPTPKRSKMSTSTTQHIVSPSPAKAKRAPKPKPPPKPVLTNAKFPDCLGCNPPDGTRSQSHHRHTCDQTDGCSCGNPLRAHKGRCRGVNFQSYTKRMRREGKISEKEAKTRIETHKPR